MLRRDNLQRVWIESPDTGVEIVGLLARPQVRLCRATRVLIERRIEALIDLLDRADGELIEFDGDEFEAEEPLPIMIAATCVSHPRPGRHEDDEEDA